MDINYYKKYEPIDGKWYITKELGSGAFGTVFEVERRDFNHAKSAMKVITIPSSQKEVKSYKEENYTLDEKSISSYFYGFVEDFTNEFKLMSDLKGNSNIVSIEDYDVIKHENEIGWDILIRMELLTPMNKYFKVNELRQRDVIKLGIDICKALEVCQKFKIIHRDIKPSNIFISKTGDFKLGDFGIARTLEKTSSGLSKKGTYTYMAPEVHISGEYGSNVDIYSLGIVMYKLLNNNFEPFRTKHTHSDEEEALIKRLKGEKIPPPANADGRLAEIITKACSFDPKERYESPLRMREELESILYNENEAKIIYPEGDSVEYEASTGNSNKNVDIINKSDDNDKTVGMFDEVTVADVEDDKTVGMFDEVTVADIEDDKTVGMFDEVTVADVETKGDEAVGSFENDNVINNQPYDAENNTSDISESSYVPMIDMGRNVALIGILILILMGIGLYSINKSKYDDTTIYYDTTSYDEPTVSDEVYINVFQVIQEPIWFNDHFIWPNRPDEVIYNCTGLVMDFNTTRFIDKTTEIVVCVKPVDGEWEVIKFEPIEYIVGDYTLNIHFDEPVDLEEFCCYPNLEEQTDESSPWNLGNATNFIVQQ